MASGDRIKETTTSTGTGNLTLLGAATGFKTLGSFFTPAQSSITLAISNDSGTEWEISKCTYINATTVSRDTVISSSNSDALVNFSAGTKTVVHTLSADDVAKFISTLAASATSVASQATSKLLMVESGVAKQITVNDFLASVGQTVGGLTAAGALTGANIITISQDGGATEVRTTLSALAAYVASTLTTATSVTMSGPSAGTVGVASTNFSIAANGLITGTVIVTPSDGGGGGTFTPTTVSISSGSPTSTFTYTPASTGTKTISVTNNSGLTNPSNISYIVSTAGATAVTMTGPSSGNVSAASTNFTIGANGTITGTVVVTPSDGGGGGTFTPTTVSISSGTPTATFTYTPSSTGAKTISVTNNGSLTNPSNITYTASAGATVPGAPTIGTATAGNTTASVTFTEPASNGGSVITGYTATSSPGGLTGTLSGATAAPITVTGLTNGVNYTFTVTATNAIGTGSASAASNSVTPIAGSPYKVNLLSATPTLAVNISASGSGSGGQYIANPVGYYVVKNTDNSNPVQATIQAGTGVRSAVIITTTDVAPVSPTFLGDTTAANGYWHTTTTGTFPNYNETSFIWRPTGATNGQTYYAWLYVRTGDGYIHPVWNKGGTTQQRIAVTITA